MSRISSTMTCIECPIGCAVHVETEEGKVVSVYGNACPRGKMYVENEVICPKRVLTTTVRMENGKILSVKTDKPIEKAKLFEVMEKIKRLHPKSDVHIGDILAENIADGANLVAADEGKYL